MTNKHQKCLVCGRNRKQYRELGIKYPGKIQEEPVIKEHQGIPKCRKCRSEYILFQENSITEKTGNIKEQLGWTAA